MYEDAWYSVESYSAFYDAAKTLLDRDASKLKYTEHIVVADVETELELRDRLAEAEDQMLEAAQAEYRIYHEQLLASQSHVDSLLGNITSILASLSSLTNSFNAVQVQSSAFQDQSQSVAREEQNASDLADKISDNLRYYDYLEPMSRRLNAPGVGRHVRDPEIVQILTHLDSCLLYMETHKNKLTDLQPSHFEAQTYRSRYRQLLTRALAIIRARFLASLRDISSDVAKRIADRQLNDTTMSALLYGKFALGAQELKAGVQEVRKRATHPVDAEAGIGAEYLRLMKELYQNYAATRRKLILPVVKKKITDISLAPSTAKNLTAFARSSISCLRSVCQDEHTLWRHWFEGDEEMDDFLKSVCEPGYDFLKPRITQETQLVKLCELCTLIQTRYMHDEDEMAEVKASGQLDFSVLIQPTLGLAQARLVLRAQAMVREEIENDAPKKEELVSFIRKNLEPNRVNGNQPGRQASVTTPITPMPKTPVVVDQDDDYFGGKEGAGTYDAELLPENWYPTLRKAIWLLSRIYRLINSAVFDDLAHEIVHQTTSSLHRAASLMAPKIPVAQRQLFLMKYLLILKFQIVAFDFEYVKPEVSYDFSNVSNTFWELRERGGLFDPRILFRLVGGLLFPRVVENMLDAKTELDGQLRTVINDFTNEFAKRMTTSLPDGRSRRGESDTAAAVQTVLKTIQTTAAQLRKDLDSFLDDVRVKETLVMAVYEQVVRDYERFYQGYKEGRQMNGGTVSTRGKGREREVWDPDTFSEWTGQILQVQRSDPFAADDSDRSQDDGPAVSP
ncbi:MAG: Golgi transport complex subunit 3 [Phylliscum demangeonii]|nr:MAG: Golgi transport complex subunit 3 [Phylliscum demangeonii]